MGPTLHYYFYGFRMDKYATTIRFGGYRPSVFLRHGLAVGVWMMSSLLMGIWLWRTKAVKVLCRFSMGFNVAALSIIFLLCRSLNAIILFAGGLLSYFAIRSLGLKSIALCLALMPVFYLVGRNIEIISAENLVETARRIDSDRATSLHIRLRHEELLAKKAWHRPLLGWGGYGRNRLQDEYGNDASITDAFWVSAFGVYGLVGLVSVGFVMLLPTVVFWSRYRTADWGDPELSPIAALVCIIPLYVIDCLMNTMLNPVFTVAAGGILGWLANKDDEPLSTSV